MRADDLVLGDLHFEVRRSAKRRTLELTVERDGSLVLAVPSDCHRERLEQFARRKRSWVYQKLIEKEALPVPPPPRRFVSGEGLPYLGKSYRLLLASDLDVPVKLEDGRFKMRRSEAGHGRDLMVQWYAEHARPWLLRRVEQYASRIGVRPEEIVVRDLGNRWGSCGKGGRLYFHWKAILLPPRLVEYVVAHELVHLLEPHHTKNYWRAVERVMPDCLARRSALGMSGPAFSVA